MPRGNGGIVGPVNTSFSGVWSLTEAQLRRSANTWPNFYSSLLSESATGSDAFAAADNADPYFEYTTLLLPGNGTNGAQNNTFLDGSTNNFTITRNGNTTQGTFSPFSQTGWGNYFNGTNAYLTFATNAAFNLGTADFTIEWNFYYSETPPAGSGYDYLFGMGASATTGIALYIQGGVPKVWNGSLVLTSSQSVVGFTWYHLALVRSSGTLTMYLNGTSVGSVSFTSNLTGGELSSGPSIGTWSPVDLSYFPGYISNFRIVKGTAIVPPSGGPTSPLTAVSGTSLLTCQSNRFRDASSNNFAATINGSPSVQAFSPFNPTASWTAATNGGSGYFDGSGDYLTVPDDASWDLSASTGSIELFVYPPVAATNTPGLIGQCPTTANWSTYIYSDGRIAIGIQGVSELATAAGSLIVNAMNHIVITRDSGTSRTRMFVNGILKATGTGTYFNNSSASLHIGYFNGYAFNGYIAEIRFCKGSIPTTYQTSSTTVGASIFTPPSAPITTSSQGATSGDVKLLLNFTNAGIYDATSKNDLETVGNAQISTAISAKWGSGSMYFDGTNSSLSALRGDLFAYGTGNFTIESWLYPTAFSNYKTIYSGYVSSSSAAGFELGSDATGALYIYSGGAFGISATSATLTINSWNHVAMVRNGSTITIYINGTSRGTWSLTTQNFTDNYCSIGKTGTGSSQYFSGYMQDFRITKGYARYTANFTAPTAAFPTL